MFHFYVPLLCVPAPLREIDFRMKISTFTGILGIVTGTWRWLRIASILVVSLALVVMVGCIGRRADVLDEGPSPPYRNSLPSLPDKLGVAGAFAGVCGDDDR